MRRLALIGSALAMTLAVAAPVAAAKPARGCPNDAFTLMGYAEFRQLSLDVGVPESLLGADHLAGWQTYDRNDDLVLCVMDLPDNAGTLGGWIFNVVDNTSNH